MGTKKLETERLLLLPFTIKICQLVNDNDFEGLLREGLFPGIGYPDQETLETIPKIIKNLELVTAPTGFESWLVITKKDMKIIGDIGFKGTPNPLGEVDFGYGIIESERRKGYAIEAATALSNWALAHPDVKKITARCLIDNHGSAKILEKLNFKRTASGEHLQYWSLD